MGSDRKWKIEEVEVKGEKFDLVTLPRPTVVPFGSLINIFLHQVRMAARAGGKVFVREDGKSSGGLIMPDNARSVVQSVTATVISVGPSCVQLLPGDEIVLLGGGMSAFLIHRGQKTMMCREDEAHGIVLPEEQSDFHKALLESEPDVLVGRASAEEARKRCPSVTDK